LVVDLGQRTGKRRIDNAAANGDHGASAGRILHLLGWAARAVGPGHESPARFAAAGPTPAGDRI